MKAPAPSAAQHGSTALPGKRAPGAVVDVAVGEAQGQVLRSLIRLEKGASTLLSRGVLLGPPLTLSKALWAAGQDVQSILGRVASCTAQEKPSKTGFRLSTKGKKHAPRSQHGPQIKRTSRLMPESHSHPASTCELDTLSSTASKGRGREKSVERGNFERSLTCRAFV